MADRVPLDNDSQRMPKQIPEVLCSVTPSISLMNFTRRITLKRTVSYFGAGDNGQLPKSGNGGLVHLDFKFQEALHCRNLAE